ncbi:hypothetical protein [Treponema denticola]|uniref:hypothetical protein n=1 Tax=Treponema denticola TaxID=158 RepID=UPI0020A42D47|nr:hypothetical protein [Treponema denticola]UTC83104.1 hypothetical protein HGJ18_07765 [Treponema denticola]
MKKTLIFILMILVLMVSSCNLFLKEEYGELIVNFDGTLPDGARALDANGLPVLSSSPMKINIIREDGYTVTRELSAEEPKSLVELVPIGEKIEIIVTAINPSGQWSGRASHTVASGQNKVTVLLNKKISGLNNLLFTQKKIKVSGQDAYELKFYMGGKEINAPVSNEEYSFGRDSKGRLYVRYKPNDTYLVRYTSEGELDVHPATTTIEFLANDYTTGKMYGIGGGLKEINENDLSSGTVSGSPASVSKPFAVDNGRVAWLRVSSPPPPLPPLPPNNIINAASLTGGSHSDILINSHIDIHHCKPSEVKDIFIRGDYVYVLFNTVNESITSSDPNLYSLGGVVRYNINNLAGNHVKIGFSNSVGFENRAVPASYYSENFYGAVKVIGFDDENIYIADDGFDAVDTPAGSRIVKNRNRIAAINIATNALSFSDAGPAKWYNEWKEWRTPNTKTVVWESLYDGSSRSGMNYYQVEKGDEDLSGANPFITSSVHESSGVLYSDVFCYDSAGNFYVSGKDNNEKLYRYVLEDDGNYETDGEKDISEKPTTIAVSVSSVPDDAGKTILFYYFESGHGHNIGRLAWYTDDFTHAAQQRNITLSDLGQNDTVTAMAANKDGIFVAVKTVTGKDSPNEKYKITVKKYAHQSLGSPAIISAVETVTVVNETSTNYPNVVVPPSHWTAEQANAYINEDLNALYISDGVLYGLTTNQKGYIKDIFSKATEVFIGGKLLKIGNTKSLGSYVVVLYKNDGLRPATSGEFAPYRFIAVKPKKLVIASDGYYGKETTPRNKNKVFVFDIGNWAHPDETVTHAIINFSKQLNYSGGSFIWTSE